MREMMMWRLFSILAILSVFIWIRERVTLFTMVHLLSSFLVSVVLGVPDLWILHSILILNSCVGEPWKYPPSKNKLLPAYARSVDRSVIDRPFLGPAAVRSLLQISVHIAWISCKPYVWDVLTLLRVSAHQGRKISGNLSFLFSYWMNIRGSRYPESSDSP